MRCGGSILSYCPRNPHGKAGNEERRKEEEEEVRMAVRYVGTVRYALIFAKKYCTLVRYAFLVMVRVPWYGTPFFL